MNFHAVSVHWSRKIISHYFSVTLIASHASLCLWSQYELVKCMDSSSPDSRWEHLTHQLSFQTDWRGTSIGRPFTEWELQRGETTHADLYLTQDLQLLFGLVSKQTEIQLCKLITTCIWKVISKAQWVSCVCICYLVQTRGCPKSIHISNIHMC